MLAFNREAVPPQSPGLPQPWVYVVFIFQPRSGLRHERNRFAVGALNSREPRVAETATLGFET